MALLRLLLIADDREQGLPLAQARALAAGLDPAEFAVRVARLSTGSGACPSTQHRNAAAEETIHVAQRWRFDPRAVLTLAQLLGRERPEVVHTFGPLAGSLGRCAALLHHDDLIAATLASDALDRWTLPERAWQRYLANRTRLNVVATPAEQTLALDARWPVRHVHVAPLAIEPLSREQAAIGNRVRTYDGEVLLPDEVELIVVAAPLEPRRRIKESIWAFDLLRSVRPNSRLLIVGRGPQRRDLEIFRDQQECHDLIHFVPDEQGIPWLSRADVLWSFDASLRPSFLTLQTIAAAAPAVVSDTIGHRPYVLHERTGFVVPTGARAAIAQATMRLLDDRQLRAEQGAAAGRHMAERFSPAAMVLQQTKLYRTEL